MPFIAPPYPETQCCGGGGEDVLLRFILASNPNPTNAGWPYYVVRSPFLSAPLYLFFSFCSVALTTGIGGVMALVTVQKHHRRRHNLASTMFTKY
jgi:hypothetical protein